MYMYLVLCKHTHAIYGSPSPHSVSITVFPPSSLKPLPTQALPGTPEEECSEVEREECGLEVGPEERLVVVVVMEKMLRVQTMTEV